MPQSGAQQRGGKTLNGFFTPHSSTTLTPTALSLRMMWTGCTKGGIKAVLISTFHGLKLLISSFKNKLHLVVCIFVIFNPFWNKQAINKDFLWCESSLEQFYFFINTCHVLSSCYSERKERGREGKSESQGRERPLFVAINHELRNKTEVNMRQVRMTQ